MKKSEFRGWTDVFRFTLVETWKNRSFLIFMIIMWVICFFSVPVLALITDSKKRTTEEYEVDKTNIETAYVVDDIMFTDIGFDVAVFQRKDVFKNVKIQKIRGKEYEEVAKQIDEEPNSIIIHLTIGMNGASFDIVRGLESKVGEKECDYIGSILVKEFDTFKYEVTGTGAEQLRAMNSQYEVVALMEQEDGEFVSEKAHISEAKYWFVYALLFIIMMIVTSSSSQVATAVAQDKSTKVMEYLLTSVRPMALVFGKVVAHMVSTVMQLGISLGLGLLSNVLTAQFMGKNFLKTKLPGGIFENITIPNVVLALLTVALGVMLYGFIAGLCGAMVRKMEELQESLSMLVMLTIIGAYLAMFASMSMQKTLTSPLFYTAVLLPISSPFLLPGVMLVGVGAWWMKLLSIAILLVLDIVILTASARVYELLILYNGSTLKPKDLIKFLRQAKGGKTA
ncbi:MAG: ABC transporter permease [Lachnospiraceae bacterium]|nr:ABC transporter permease [Lachnospiraceae bacterium]